MRAVLTLMLVALAGAARADVVDAGTNGFTVHIATPVNAPAARVYEAIVKIGSWWAADHTYSGNSANLTLDPTPGGCWCEKTSSGGVQHMTVVYVDRGKALRLRGALGPLQEMGATGALTFTLKETGGATALDVTYSAGGYVKGGFEGLAKAVDGVMTMQVMRLKKVVETGKPE